jgi:hypothetical protein
LLEQIALIGYVSIGFGRNRARGRRTKAAPPEAPSAPSESGYGRLLIPMGSSKLPGNVCSLLAILTAINGSSQATTDHVRPRKLQADTLSGVVQSHAAVG